MLQVQERDDSNITSSNRGTSGLNEGRLPHIADAISLFDSCWGSIEPNCIMKCWLKSGILPESHATFLKRKLMESDGPTIDLTHATNVCEYYDESEVDNHHLVSAEIISQVTDGYEQIEHHHQSSHSEVSEFIQELVQLEAHTSVGDALQDTRNICTERLQDIVDDDEVQSLFDSYLANTNASNPREDRNIHEENESTSQRKLERINDALSNLKQSLESFRTLSRSEEVCRSIENAVILTEEYIGTSK